VDLSLSTLPFRTSIRAFLARRPWSGRIPAVADDALGRLTWAAGQHLEGTYLTVMGLAIDHWPASTTGILSRWVKVEPPCVNSRPHATARGWIRWRGASVEVVLVLLKTDRICALNRTGARLWDPLCADHDRAEMERQGRREMGVGDAELASALDELLAALMDESLIASRGEP
jgi:hypothetical protein